jgi:ABC-type phosphate/phosphonate transport system substrate-binding protein
MNIASLPWYELPETQAAQDAFWSVLASHLRQHGVRDAPDALTRGVPVQRLLTNPGLLVAQCCGYDLIYGFAGSVTLLATPAYDAPGCDGANYRSLILAREDWEAEKLDDLRGSVCVINSFNSHSGTNALRAEIAPLSRDGRFFAEVKVSGSHLASLALLLAGEADVMAMDCVLHALLTRYRPEALRGTRSLGWTQSVPAPPFVTSSSTDGIALARLRDALAGAVADDAGRDARDTMLLRDIEFRPLSDYSRIVDLEAEALRHGYAELHATSAAIAR